MKAAAISPSCLQPKSLRSLSPYLAASFLPPSLLRRSSSFTRLPNLSAMSEPFNSFKETNWRAMLMQAVQNSELREIPSGSPHLPELGQYVPLQEQYPANKNSGCTELNNINGILSMPPLPAAARRPAISQHRQWKSPCSSSYALIGPRETGMALISAYTDEAEGFAGGLLTLLLRPCSTLLKTTWRVFVLGATVVETSARRHTPKRI
ncbi:hypothetical protein M422DRAFT_239788 [Sphaerobolus stellatus SS14]|nr:hypothetical protein M422DRAFT_239788 [Sphaerobolus stellatus SS14]